MESLNIVELREVINTKLVSKPKSGKEKGRWDDNII